MKILTRLTLLLFVILFGMSIGGAFVVQDAVVKSRHFEASVFRTAHQAVCEESAQREARLAEVGLRRQLESRVQAVNAQTLAISRGPILADALRLDAQGVALFSRTQRFLSEAGAGLDSVSLFDRDGQIVRLSVTGEASPGTKKDIFTPPRVTVPDPEGKERPLPGMVNEALRGVSWAGYGRFSGEVRAMLSDKPTRHSKQPALALMAIYPVVGVQGDVVGAVLGTVEASRDTVFLKKWYDGVRRDGWGLSAAILFEGQRIATVGEGLKPGSRLTAEEWKSLKDTPETLISEGGQRGIRIPLLDRQQKIIGALEVTLVPGTSSLAALEPGEEDADRQRLFRNALSIISILAVLGLVIGIMGSRQVVRPIRRLCRRAELVSTGKMDASFKDLSGSDDVGELARSFERMRISIRKLMDREKKTLAEEPLPEATITGEILPHKKS